MPIRTSSSLTHCLRAASVARAAVSRPARLCSFSAFLRSLVSTSTPAGAVLDVAGAAPRPHASSVSRSTSCVDRRLGDAAAAAPRDVRRRDVHVVDVPAGSACASSIRASRSRTPMTLVREALVDRRVERHVAGAVHDRVDVGRQRRYVGQVALDDRDPRRHQRLDPAGRLDDLGEDRLLEQLGDPVRAAGRRPWAAPAPTSARPGTSVSIRCSSASPTKPVTPVSRTCCPASRSATDPSALTRCDRAMARDCATRGVLALRLRRPAAQPRVSWTFFLRNRRAGPTHRAARRSRR